MKNCKLYNFLFDYSFPIFFFWFVGIIIMIGLNAPIFITLTCFILLLIFVIFSTCYLYIDVKKIKFWLNCRQKYILTDDEKKLWDNIEIKAKQGYKEWFDQTRGDDLCGPWIKDISPGEVELIDKIHRKYYGKDWYVVLPLTTSQVCYVEYEDIKNKVI